MSDQPNVLWIMADQHNPRCTSWGTYPTRVRTPNLERLADTGTRFERAFAQSPSYTPSRTSFVTGQYPLNHGCYDNGGAAPDFLTSAFELFSDLDYRTAAIGSIHTPTGLIEDHVDRLEATHSHPADPAGPTAYEETLRNRGVLDDRDDEQLPEWVAKAGPDARQPFDARPSRLDFEDQPEYWAGERARDFIADTDDDPFFAWLSLHRPHLAWTPAERFWDAYPEDDLAFPPSADEDLSDKPPHQRRKRDGQTADRFAVFDPETDEGLRKRALRGYLGCVSQVDAVVGRVLDFLEAEGLREDTIVVYCADHGDFALEHGLLGKIPGTSYDAISRIPFVWSWPGEIREGAVVSELVESVDFLPTLLGLVADESVPTADGHDVTPFLEGTTSEPVREYAVTETPWARCVRSRTQKLTVYPRNFFGDGTGEVREFYDLESDPWETRNRADDDSMREAVERHREYLYDFMATRRRYWTCPYVDGPAEDDARPTSDTRVSPSDDPESRPN